MINESINDSIGKITSNLCSNAVGNDLVFLPDFTKTCTQQFIERAYTETEITYCEQFPSPVLHYASTWAAKEAVYKVLKQIDPTISIGWRSIEIVRNKPSGKPDVYLIKINVSYNIALSISHDGEYVWAIALNYTSL